MVLSEDLTKRLNAIEDIVSEEEFRQNKGLGNDIGYYIFDYPPSNELEVRDFIKVMVKRVNGSNLGFQIVVFDLYEIIFDVLESKGYLEKCEEIEKEKGTEHLSKAIGKMLRLTSVKNPVVTYIYENTPKNSVVFLTGIGSSYPILRAHNILNNLQQVLDTVPVVMFYPGEYTGQELRLFGTMKDDNFYRAFPLPMPWSGRRRK